VAPDVTTGSRVVLKRGAGCTIEPGVYLPGKFGVRLEIDVHITDQGAEVL
jgi:Xaa-Pro dipeptidase